MRSGADDEDEDDDDEHEDVLPQPYTASKSILNRESVQECNQHFLSVLTTAFRNGAVGVSIGGSPR